jgi:drug/metabolite transporter (DMT)-like permease
VEDLKKNNLFLIIFCLAAVYIIWSATYIAIKIAVKDMPSLLVNGIRFVASGLVMYLYALASGRKNPSLKQWLNSSIIGTLLFFTATGFVSVAVRSVGSGLSAIAIAGVSLWACLITGFFGKWPNKLEWAGLIVGFIGIIMLNMEHEMRSSSIGTIMLLIAPLSWALGSVLSTRIELPEGYMGHGLEMLTGGMVNVIAGFIMGERIAVMPSAPAVWSIIYLIIFGSIAGFTAYMYLYDNVRPALATSYSYVNPLGAVLIGVFFANEHINKEGIAALFLILAGVVFVAFGEVRAKKKGILLNVEANG